MHDIAICRFQPVHVPQFLLLAEQEGWVCHCREFEFLLGVFPQGAYVALEDGMAVAFVTAVRHDRSGWIGNLLVHQSYRGKGLGREMFNRAMASLESAGVATIWLTASEKGRRLYESHGFQAIDTIVRRVGYGRYQPPVQHLSNAVFAMAEEVDKEGWGDRRIMLLKNAMTGNHALVDRDGHLVLQHIASGIQIGPWSSRNPVLAGSHLARIWRRTASTGHRVIMDSPYGNQLAGKLLADAGFSETGSTVLMCRGKAPEYRPASIYALASMG